MATPPTSSLWSLSVDESAPPLDATLPSFDVDIEHEDGTSPSAIPFLNEQEEPDLLDMEEMFALEHIDDDPTEVISSSAGAARPQDLSLISNIEMTKEIPANAKYYTKGDSVAALFNISKGKIVDQWIIEDSFIREMMAKFNEWRIKQGVIKEHARLSNVSKLVDDYECDSRRRFSMVDLKDMESWDTHIWHAYMMWTLENYHVKLSTGKFAGMMRLWITKVVCRSRLWQLMQRIKLKYPKSEAEAKQTRDAKLNALEKHAEAGISAISKITLAERENIIRKKKSAAAPPSNQSKALRAEHRALAEELGDAPSTTSKAKSRRSDAAHGGFEKVFDETFNDIADKKSLAHLRLLDSPETLALVQELADDPGALERDPAKFQELLSDWKDSLPNETLEAAIFENHSPQQKEFIHRKTPEQSVAFLKQIQQEYTSLTNRARDQAKAKAGDDEDELKRLKSQYYRNSVLRSGAYRQLQNVIKLGALVHGDVSTQVTMLPRPDTTTKEDEDDAIMEQAESIAIEGAAHDADIMSREIATAAELGEHENMDESDSARMTALLSNTKYEQGDDFAAACEDLHLDPRKPMRLPGQSPGSHSLYWFQLMVINFARRVVKTGYVRGALITALVGLGKTLMIAGIILADLVDRHRIIHQIQMQFPDPGDKKERQRRYRDQLPVNRPYLIIAPPSIALQMHQELTQFSHKLEVLYHHADSRTKGADAMAEASSHVKRYDIPADQRFSYLMDKTSDVLHPTSHTCARVIICTPETWTRRYGPGGLLRDVKANLQAQFERGEISKKRLGDLIQAHQKPPLFLQPNRKWSRDFCGRFRMLFIDEGQMVRNPVCQMNVAGIWLDPDQIHITTATPIWNSDRDLWGYIKLLAGRDNAHAYHDLHPVDHKLKAINPFTNEWLDAERARGGGQLPTSTVKALLTAEAYDKWVKKSSGDLGHEIRVNFCDHLFTHAMIRHTYASSIPTGVPEYSIGRTLPKAYRYGITISMPPVINRQYQVYSAPHKHRLRMQVESKTGEKFTGINRNAMRIMIAGSTWVPTMMVSFKHGERLIKDQEEGMQKARDFLVETTQANASAAALEKMTAQVAEQDIEPWPEYPHAPAEWPPGMVPDRNQILSSIWPKWETHWAMSEVEPLALFHRLEEEAQRVGNQWSREAYILTWFMNRSKSNAVTSIAQSDDQALDGVKFWKTFGDIPDPKTEKYTAEVQYRIAKLCIDTSPRWHQLSKQLYDAARRGEKTSVWCTVPFSQHLTHCAMTVMGCHTMTLTANLSDAERAEVVADFNTPSLDSVQHLVISPDVGGVGLNLQKAHHVVIVCDAVELLSILEQIFGRAFRCGQLHDCHFYTYHVRRSIDATIATRCYNAALVSIATTMDALALFEQTGANVPTGESKKDFIVTLKKELSGFYWNSSNEGAKRLRHITAFKELTAADDVTPELLEACTMWKERMYLVPSGFTELLYMGVLRRIYMMFSGQKIPSIVENPEVEGDLAAWLLSEHVNPDDDENDPAAPPLSDEIGKALENHDLSELTVPGPNGEPEAVYATTKLVLIQFLKSQLEDFPKKATLNDLRVRAHIVINTTRVNHGMEPIEYPNDDEIQAWQEEHKTELKASAQRKKGENAKAKQEKRKAEKAMAHGMDATEVEEFKRPRTRRSKQG